MSDSLFPETKRERYKRLLPFALAGWSTCPTANGQDLEVWEEIIRDVR